MLQKGCGCPPPRKGGAENRTCPPLSFLVPKRASRKDGGSWLPLISIQTAVRLALLHLRRGSCGFVCPPCPLSPFDSTATHVAAGGGEWNPLNPMVVMERLEPLHPPPPSCPPPPIRISGIYGGAGLRANFPTGSGTEFFALWCCGR